MKWLFGFRVMNPQRMKRLAQLSKFISKTIWKMAESFLSQEVKLDGTCMKKGAAQTKHFTINILKHHTSQIMHSQI